MGTNLIISGLIRLFVVRTIMSQFTCTPTTNLTDQSALLAFKAQIIFGSNNPLVDNWTTKTSFCNWIGVSCSSRRQRVTALNLSYMDLQGTLSPHIGNLSFLTILNIRNNSFHGPLPETIGLLRRLRVINLRYNQLAEKIPSSLSQCRRLQGIIMASNHFQGTIPKEMGNLPALEILQLSKNNLGGTIPFTLFNISTLRVIDLHKNNISGRIPMDMCHGLPKLEIFHLSINSINGHIPTSVCNCTKLREINLWQNRFIGSIPKDLGCLSNLEYLNLGRNQLTGTVPPSLGNLSRVEHLDLINNNLGGGIPEELAQLSSIKYLQIAFNNLSGELPRVIFNISSVELISFMKNRISGYLPELTGLWHPNLKYLLLEGNQLEGKIPYSISNASKLTILELSHNFFNGPVPLSLGSLEFLVTLNLQRNRLTNDLFERELQIITSLTKCKALKNLVLGPNPLNVRLPDSIGNLSKSLQLFNADASSIQGSIPVSIGNLSNVNTVELAYNNLTGGIPSTIGALGRLQRLRLFQNKIEGRIPDELCQLTFLGELALHENKFSGPIPYCIGNLTQLQVISLSSNALTSIPLSLWSLENVWLWNLSLNSLSGNLPSNIGNLMIVAVFDLSNNQLSESIPSAISNMRTLRYLNLSRNSFQGSIPETIGNLASLESLDLSSNNMSGTIPKSMERLQCLKKLNLSLNRLTGQVPTGGPFQNFTALSFMGNDGLCGTPNLELPACPVDAHSNSRKMKLWLRYIIPSIALAAILSALSVVLVIYCVKRRSIPSPVEFLTEAGYRYISYFELLRATENFSEENLLGIGSVGSVYKGTMSNGEIIAVKVLNLQVDAALRSFDAECEVLRNVRHRNLVKIISSCSNLDFRALVLEYMPHGSLDKLLYSQDHCLDLLQRINIMIDVALALEYLHHGYSEPVVHCDLKPSNILLNEDMVAHVGDFGLAKILAKHKSMTHTATLGTMGYIAPEYGSEGRVSTKGDVYSYGIMLMEMSTRKRPNDEMFEGGLSLRGWINLSFPDQVMQVADPSLFTSEERSDGKTKNHLRHCLSSIMELALLCSRDSPEGRLDMKEVVVKLTKIKQDYLLSINLAS